MFGNNYPSVNLTINEIDFLKMYSEVGETALVEVLVGSDSEKALIKDVQRHPVTNRPLHVGFYKVNLLEKITAEIPVEVIGEETNPLLKSGEGMLLMILNTIEVSCLPGDLPQHFTVDVSGITEIGDGFFINQLQYDKDKVTLTGDLDEEELILKIDYAEMQETAEDEEAVEEATAISGLEATKEVKAEEESETTE